MSKLLTVGLLLLVGGCGRGTPRAHIAQHALGPDGNYSVEVEFEDIPYSHVYARDVAIRVLRDGSMDRARGITRSKVTGGGTKVTYTFDTKPYLDKYDILLPSGKCTVEFSDGKEEIRVFQGQNRSGDRYRAYIGMGRPRGAEQSAPADPAPPRNVLESRPQYGYRNDRT